MAPGVRSAMRAASQLPGKGPTDVDDAPAPARLIIKKINYDIKCQTVWTPIRSGQNVRPDLGPNCLKGLSADDKVM